MVLTRISWSHGKAQNLMLGRSYYASKRGIYLNGFTVQSKKLIKGSLICSKHKGMKKCLNFFVVSMMLQILRPNLFLQKEFSFFHNHMAGGSHLLELSY